ncbi:ABC transporter substrate-binding protein [Trueperella pyogenes]|uniref:ABC transporter substrate-binding protein n=1 Tax=Trueperella pyogenes TaxID=1661 RepID=A0ABV3NCU6_9ACTO|nr:ABC transporter substrate-binding protein [Trueperella pyogenes]MDF2420902.1 ABC transporter substrate-binding protein [Trueperella pyogenes]UVJ53625.1 ABC transporter substrate-binding protein [Trueperella pyogenes]UVJ57665.1 ABC transporter substrate-binding protein [Trueperella pyogenes]UVJ59612.1 ABC transporter substrate-binding protein [Trueperella pyogenes]
MKLTKPLALVAALTLFSVSLSACSGNTGSSSGASGTSAGANRSIAVVAKGYASPFWAAVKSGVEAAGKDLGYEVTFNGPDNETDVTRQNDQLNQALVRNPAALAFAALDSTAQSSVLQQFADAGIPVVAFDSGVPGSDIPLTTVATDNKAAAAEGAKHLSELIGKKGKVAIICHSQTSLTGQDREHGFRDWLTTHAPDVKVVEVQYNNSDQAIAQQQASAILQAHPDLVGLFATDDDGAVAAAQAVKTSGRNGVKVVGFDSGKPQLELIKEGVIAGSITQNPYQMGYDAIVSVDKVLKGGKLEKFTDSGFYWYDAKNLDDPKIKKAVYE